MNKQEFLRDLDKSLSRLPRAEREKAAEFYSEAIDDRVEDGMTEEEAVAALGTVGEAADEAVLNAPFKALMSAGMIIGSPLWLPLLITLAAVALCVYVSIWSVVVSLFAAALSIAVSGAACVVGGLVFCWTHPVSGIALLGAGLALSGAALALYPVCVLCARGTVKLAVISARGVKKLFIKKVSVK